LKELWNKEQEIRFFTEAKEFAKVEQLFYRGDDGRYYAYWPKNYKGVKGTLQARNALIGGFTEKWSADLLQDFAQSKGCYVVQGAICDEIGLPRLSPADLAVCRTKNINQKPEDITLIIEVKMSVVWNWELRVKDGEEVLVCLGDYETHQGNPGLLRSDTMLKAIGKSINIRVSSPKASRVPILILGNTPITSHYYEKVDHLRRSGVIQGFWSVNPNPLDNNKENIKSTHGSGFLRFDTYDELINKLNELLREEKEFFSGMRTRTELGRMIEIANREDNYEKKAQRFLELIKE
jgi:hypothetical protein